MVVGLQDELSTQLHVIAVLVHFIDQHSVKVLVLREKIQQVELLELEVSTIIIHAVFSSKMEH